MPAEGGACTRGMASPLATTNWVRLWGGSELNCGSLRSGAGEPVGLSCDIRRWGRRKGRSVMAGGPDGCANGDPAVEKTGLTGSACPDTETFWKLYKKSRSTTWSYFSGRVVLMARRS